MRDDFKRSRWPPPDYRTVTTRFRGLAPSGKAFFVDCPPSRGQGTVTIPRSLIHGGDDLLLNKLAKNGAEITFRLVDWKADQLGFAE